MTGDEAMTTRTSFLIFALELLTVSAGFGGGWALASWLGG
jgi:hypothetical protein